MGHRRTVFSGGSGRMARNMDDSRERWELRHEGANAEGYCRKCRAPLGISGICAVCAVDGLLWPALPKFEFKDGMHICLKVGEQIHIFDEHGALVCGEGVDDDGQVTIAVPTCEKCLKLLAEKGE